MFLIKRLLQNTKIANNLLNGKFYYYKSTNFKVGILLIGFLIHLQEIAYQKILG